MAISHIKDVKSYVTGEINEVMNDFLKMSLLTTLPIPPRVCTYFKKTRFVKKENVFKENHKKSYIELKKSP